MPDSSDNQTAQRNPSVLSHRDYFLEHYEKEFQTTLRVLRAFPTDQLDFRAHPTSRTARELAWIFPLERMLGMMVFMDKFIEQTGSGESPPPPDSWENLLETLLKSHREYGDMIRGTPDSEMDRQVRFFTGPRTVGTFTRIDWLWFMLHDEIHHRGQFSVLLRMTGGKVPSIYGPSGDEKWF